MKLFLALFISLSIHLGVIYLLSDSKIFEHKTYTQSKEKTTKTHIKYVKLKPQQKVITQKQPSQKPKEIIKKPKIIDLPKELQQTKPIIEKQIPQKLNQNIKPKQKPIQKELPKKIPPEQLLTKEQQKYKELQKNITPQTKEYIDLYDDFEKMPTDTKVFLIKNLNDIGKITQRYLFYPTMSAQAGQEGVNVIEFMLFKNGNISNPKIVKSSGYFILDDNTKETIQSAYVDYPRPSKPTPIRIYVKYKLIRE